MNTKEQFRAARRYYRGETSLFNIPPNAANSIMRAAQSTVDLSKKAWHNARLGCQCKSCKQTNKFIRDGFHAWPRGNPAGRRSNSDYNSHVNACTSGGHAGMKIGSIGVGFYGTSPGMTKAEQAEVLRRTFSVTVAEE